MVEGKRILITGGAGFIGTGLAERLVERNTVVLYDCQHEGMPLTYSPIVGHPNLLTIRGDVRDYERLARAVDNADIIVHLAAIVGVNNVLQGKLSDGIQDFARVTFNSTFGLLGLIDVATDFNLPKHNEDFGQTLATLGIVAFEIVAHILLHGGA